MSSGPPTRAAAQAPRSLPRTSRERHNFDDIILQTRQEATDVVERMFDILSQYGMVQVSELYAMVGIEATHADVKWGWVELRGARPVRLRNGTYLLDLPDPVPLD